MQKDESPYIHNPEAGYQALELRFQTVTRIVDMLNANMPIEDKVKEMGNALGSLIPFDRFGLGLLWANRWYILDHEGLHKTDIYRTRPTSDNFSVTRWVSQNKKPLVRADIQADCQFEYDKFLLADGIRSDLVVPLIVEGQVIGTFNFTSRKIGAYAQEQCQAAESIASAVAAVVKLLQDQLFLDGIREISEAIQGSLNLDEVLQRSLDHIHSQGYDRVRVYLFDEISHELIGAAQTGGSTKNDFKDFRIAVADDVYSRETLKGRQARIYRFGELGRGLRDKVEAMFEGLDYAEKAELPLFVVEEGKDRVVGKITVDNGLSGNPLIQDRLDALMLYAAQAAIAIRQAQLYQTMEKEVVVRTSQLRESELRLRRLSEATFEGIVISKNGIILDANEQYCNMLGYEYDELIGREVVSIVAPQMQKRVRKYIEAGYEGLYQSINRHKDGTEFAIEVRGRNVSQDGDSVRVTAIRDISERIQLEQERIHLERTSALGELAQGVAHNFNNLLVGILGYAQLLQLKLKDDEMLEDVDQLIKSALRARDLVRNLNVAVRGEPDKITEINVNDVVDGAVALTQPRWKDESEAQGIDIRMKVVAGDVPVIQGAVSRLQDVLVNLIFNAVDAMPDGGTITVETSEHKGWAQVLFRDTGAGMDEETQRRAFEPFFTTKRIVGTGLGLATVYGTITRWGGTIEIEHSVPGEGTTIVLRLPPCSETNKD